jgi:hypothetical protein
LSLIDLAGSEHRIDSMHHSGERRTEGGIYYTVPHYTILYYIILCYTVLHYTIWYYYTVLYYTVFYYTIVHSSSLCYISLHNALVHYTIPCYILYTLYHIAILYILGIGAEINASLAALKVAWLGVV